MGNILQTYLFNSPVLPEVIVQVRRVVLNAEPANGTLLHLAAEERLEDGVVADEESPPVTKVRPDTKSRGLQDRLDVRGEREKALKISRLLPRMKRGRWLRRQRGLPLVRPVGLLVQMAAGMTMRRCHNFLRQENGYKCAMILFLFLLLFLANDYRFIYLHCYKITKRLRELRVSDISLRQRFISLQHW